MHQARKRFGQNFLHDPGTIRRIIEAIRPRPGESLVEIGPGQGAITRGLLEQAGALDAIELDRDLIEPLRERLAGVGALRIHSADALRFDLCTLAPRPASLRLVGNLPYNISTPLMFRFLEQAECIADMHLMLQREVVERIAADPGNKVYGRLSVMVQTWCDAQLLFRIGPGAFTPAPKVESALLRLRPLRPLPHPLVDPAGHARLVAAAFSQRRKTLRNSLLGLADASVFAAAGIDPGQRAETVDVAGFIRLANAVHRPDAEPACNSRAAP
ncbi:MAG: 16S rRNA (adenine(1518)-N(6)/adenine(1519)-N(6))-dimethyltransferase RsmA [Lamprocystis purpurea]|jgi:16S rRNA (adenine1518-N6/adenine1519-N6)-dimethyltransferase|uniref:16S rRNA (adenine(1518)-N(6)/adenine(1519)-N(6))- dimethyltransferase RsmA n=1 Tax=Lamprocystis purpurea TaxID=61598 RepID=UPI00037B767E|nr:16S rRNA (adenine(1518)-N(6)/adenine(1519)-N(6))-dimethyltransferase RsmA [Lamprocystis purpurea]MBV5274283.1 16S rRNA (adenine(1518)-N(6)/adenine(1519)-N(6))-dimethyltransferase RsmA [Lamprocystis purpurea]